MEATCWGWGSLLVGFPDCFLCIVCALFDLRYPGVHQSGSGSGQHQRGGRWTLPRHEWERRALWVGESKNLFLSFTTPPSPCSSGSHSQQVWHSNTRYLFYGMHYFPATLRKLTFFVFPFFFFYNTRQYWAIKNTFSGAIWEPVCYQGSCTWQMGKPQWDKTSMFLLQSLTLSVTYFPFLQYGDQSN